MYLQNKQRVPLCGIKTKETSQSLTMNAKNNYELSKRQWNVCYLSFSSDFGFVTWFCLPVFEGLGPRSEDSEPRATKWTGHIIKCRKEEDCVLLIPCARNLAFKNENASRLFISRSFLLSFKPLHS